VLATAIDDEPFVDKDFEGEVSTLVDGAAMLEAGLQLDKQQRQAAAAAAAAAAASSGEPDEKKEHDGRPSTGGAAAGSSRSVGARPGSQRGGSRSSKRAVVVPTGVVPLHGRPEFVSPMFWGRDYHVPTVMEERQVAEVLAFGEEGDSPDAITLQRSIEVCVPLHAAPLVL
jgi:hypothetical protein